MSPDVAACQFLDEMGWGIGLFDPAGQPIQISPGLLALLPAGADTRLRPLLEALVGVAGAAPVCAGYRSGRTHHLFRHPRLGICRLIVREHGERVVLVAFPLDAEGERLVRNEILAELVEQAPEPVGFMDAQLRLRYANRSCRELIGVEEGAPLSELPHESLLPTGIGGLDTADALALSQGAGPVQLITEVRNIRTGDIETVDQTVMAHAQVLLGEVFYSAIGREATAAPAVPEAGGQLQALVEAQRQLIRENTARLHYSWEIWRSVVEHNPALVLLTNAAGEIHFSNRGFIGASALPLIGCNLFELMAEGPFREELRALAGRIAAGLQPHASLEGECHLPDGRRLHCLWQASHLRREDSSGLTWVITDMTREFSERLRAQAMEKFAATGRVAARIAHEFNNPLAGIRNALALVKMDMAPGTPGLRYLDMVDGEIDRLAAIIRQMYGLYKPDTLAPSAIALPGLLAECAFLMQPVAAARGVRLDLGAVPALTLQLPEPFLREIVYNLVRNAIEASAAGDAVTLHASDEGSYLALLVDDRGHGLPPDGEARLFEPFFTTKETFHGAGLGLGLSVCRSLAETMGGCVGLAPREGGGVRATLALPLTPAD